MLLFPSAELHFAMVQVMGFLWVAVHQSGQTLLAVGGVGLDGFHISGVASGRPRCGGGFRGDDGCTPSMGLSVDTEFRRGHSGL